MRITLAPAGPPLDLAEHLLRRVPAPEEAGQWTQDAERASVLQITALDGSEAHGLHLFGHDRHELRIPGPFGASRVNAVALELVAGSDFTLRAAMVREGGAPVSAVDYAFLKGGQRRRVRFDFRSLAPHKDAFDELLLIANGQRIDWTLVSVELLERPLESWLPPSAAPELIALEQEARRGVGLSSRAPLRAQVRIPDGAELRLAYGWPKKMGAGEGGATLHVRIESEGREALERSLALGPGFPKAPAWSVGTVDVSELGGRDASITFSLSTERVTAVCALAEPMLVRRGERAPTVLLVTSDTHRGDHLGTAPGGVDVHTPNLDRLAAGGVYFQDCFASSNVTIPSHAALFTGLHPRDTGVIDNQTPLSGSAETLAERFRAAGWLTWGIASTRHLNHEWSGLGQGFDRMSWPRDRQRIGDETLEILDRWLPDAEGRPLLLWLHLFDAHRPYEPPEAYRHRYYPRDKDPFDPALPEPEFPPPPWLNDLRDAEWARAQYRGEVSYVDDLLGRVLSQPRFESAVVAVTADHGESLGAHGIYWNHVGLHPDTVHVPLILSFPGAPSGLRVARPVRQWDLARTLLGLAGLPTESFPGTDLMQTALAEDVEETPRFAIASFGHSASVNLGRWHLILQLRSYFKNAETERWGVCHAHEVELYDLVADPGCTRDLVDSQLEVARELRALLVKWLLAAGPGALAGSVDPSAEAIEDLAQLGYASGSAARPVNELFDPDCRCEYCARFAE